MYNQDIIKITLIIKFKLTMTSILLYRKIKQTLKKIKAKLRITKYVCIY